MLKNVLFIFVSVAIMSCSNAPKGEKAEVSEKTEAASSDVNGQNFTINADQSMAMWEGTKPTGKHAGTIKIQSGNIQTDASGITSASIIIDMASLNNTDLEGQYKSDLEGHLKSGDFFDVAQFPTAKFEMTKMTGLENDESGSTHLIYGNLTLKDVTKQIGVKATVKTSDSDVAIKIPAFKIDRTEFGIKYKSKKFFDNLKDKFINDEIAVSLQIIATK